MSPILLFGGNYGTSCFYRAHYPVVRRNVNRDAREAADLYREHGRMEQYVHYLETHLGKFSKEYLELIEYYCTVGDESKARHVAREGLKNCKDDLTELFIFLLQDAKKYGEDEEYKKLYASANRRNKANIVRINKSLQ